MLIGLEISKNICKIWTETLKELMEQASIRLMDINGLHEERIKILQQLSSLQGLNKGGKLLVICGGGRYDRLLSTFGGDDIPACGFGFGDAVIYLTSWCWDYSC